VVSTAAWACLIVASVALTACSPELMGPTLPDFTESQSVLATVNGSPVKYGDAGPVLDLRVVSTTSSSLLVRWTQVHDGAGRPALYRVKYANAPIDYGSAQVACSTIHGTAIGEPAYCEIRGLPSGASREIQLRSYRLVDGQWRGATASNVAVGRTDDGAGTLSDARTVSDLRVHWQTSSKLRLRWTQVADGWSAPARYRVKFDRPSFSWPSAATGCSQVIGGSIGANISCDIDGLPPGTTYEVQLMSYRLVDGQWQNTRLSNIAVGRTTEASADANGDDGIWISRRELGTLPMSGAAWANLLEASRQYCGYADLSDGFEDANVCIMAKALVTARTGDPSLRGDVIRAIEQVIQQRRYWGGVLALGRELGAYVIAADLIDLKNLMPALDTEFRATLRDLRTVPTEGGVAHLIECHELRPNNWGAHCGATRAAIAAYLGDTADLARTARVFKGYLGDRSSYAGFIYGGPAGSLDLSWQCNPSRPVGVNPPGCMRDGLSIDGVLADDQRRAGSFTTPPPQENYVWEGLQGLLAQAIILERAGYPAFDWESQALRRAAGWLHWRVDYPAEGDDTWQPHVLNHFYGTRFPALKPARPGKNVGWTDWTHGN
jgi:hypothetical protein